jgi:hypothetical protein
VLLQDAAKQDAFFDGGLCVPYASTLDAHLEESSGTMFSWVSEDILMKVLVEMMFDPLDANEKVNSALKIFVADYDGPRGNGEHKVTITRVLAFSLVIDYVGAGLSFQQACACL